MSSPVWILTSSQWIVLVVISVLVLALGRSRYPPAILFGSSVVVFYWLDLISTEQILQNFINPAVVLVFLLSLVVVILEQSVFIATIGVKLCRGSYRWVLLRVIGFAVLTSSIMSNTAVVATLLSSIRKNRSISPSRLLMPLSFAALMGGTLTLFGTSTHLLLSGLATDAGLPALGFFQFTPIGLPVVLVCGAFLLVFGPLLLPQHRQDKKRKDKQLYLIEARVSRRSELIGHQILGSDWCGVEGLKLTSIRRGREVWMPEDSNETLERNDVLTFSGYKDHIDQLHQISGLKWLEYGTNEQPEKFFEAVVRSQSSFCGKTLKSLNFCRAFGAVVVAIDRGHEALEGPLGKVKLQAGDCLVLATSTGIGQPNALSKEFHVLDRDEFTEAANLGEDKLLDNSIVVGGFIAVLLLCAAGVMPYIKGVASYVIVMLILRHATLSQFNRVVPFGLCIVIISSLSLAQVVAGTGLADLLATSIGHVSIAKHPVVVVSAVFLCAFILTQWIHNNAAAALVFPVAYSLSVSESIPSMALIMAVAFGANCSFMTPYSYQTHMMVFSAGSYRHVDFLRIGVWMSLAYAIIAIVAIYLVYL